jgi:hypothetical protein
LKGESNAKSEERKDRKPHLRRDDQQWVFDYIIKETGKTFHFQPDSRGRLPRTVRSHDMIAKHVGLAARRSERLAQAEAGRGPSRNGDGALPPGSAAVPTRSTSSSRPTTRSVTFTAA